jgi:hypothetical protein
MIIAIKLKHTVVTNVVRFEKLPLTMGKNGPADAYAVSRIIFPKGRYPLPAFSSLNPLDIHWTPFGTDLCNWGGSRLQQQVRKSKLYLPIFNQCGSHSDSLMVEKNSTVYDIHLHLL